MLRKAVYHKVESLLNRIAGSLEKQGFTPNQLTLTGVAVNFLAGWVFALGNFMLAGLLVILAAMGDLLDGPLARTSGKSSKFGAFLDSTMDRYSDFFLFGGLALYYARHDQAIWLILTLGIILGAYVTSYAKARSENFIKKCGVGLVERAERVIALALGGLIPPLMGPILVLLFVGTQFTALQRIFHTRKMLAPQADKDQSKAS